MVAVDGQRPPGVLRTADTLFVQNAEIEARDRRLPVAALAVVRARLLEIPFHTQAALEHESKRSAAARLAMLARLAVERDRAAVVLAYADSLFIHDAEVDASGSSPPSQAFSR